MVKISKRLCDELAKAPPTGTRRVEWDDELAGFGVRISARGKLSYVLKYRIRGNPQQIMHTLGEWPATNPADARAEASRIKAAATTGHDIVQERRQDAAAEEARKKRELLLAMPVSALLDSWTATLEHTIARNLAAGASASYEKEHLRLAQKKLRPAIGEETVGDLDPRRFQALINLEGGVSSARGLRNALVAFIGHANDTLVTRGIPVEWPAKFTVKGRVQSREDRYSLPEAARIWIAMGSMGRRGALVRFMLLTGCRRSEASNARRPQMKLEDPLIGPVWEQPGRATKNGRAHRVPLSPAAVRLLEWLPARAGSELVFPGRGGKVVGGWTDIKREMMRLARLDAGQLHDFRRTIVSALADNGFDPQVADKLLNHSAASTFTGVMAVYQRSELWMKLREAIAMWTDLLFAAIDRELGEPVSRESWGIEGKFVDVRIVRPKRQLSPAQVLRAGTRPSRAGAKASSSQVSRSSSR